VQVLGRDCSVGVGGGGKDGDGIERMDEKEEEDMRKMDWEKEFVLAIPPNLIGQALRRR